MVSHDVVALQPLRALSVVNFRVDRNIVKVEIALRFEPFETFPVVITVFGFPMFDAVADVPLVCDVRNACVMVPIARPVLITIPIQVIHAIRSVCIEECRGILGPLTCKFALTACPAAVPACEPDVIQATAIRIPCITFGTRLTAWHRWRADITALEFGLSAGCARDQDDGEHGKY